MPPSHAQARLAEFLETAERLKNERATAGGVLETVEATPPAAWPTLATRPEFQTNAALERLGEEVRRRLDRNPREALALAELATTIADGLPEKTYPAVTMAQIRAMAWKDRANALRFLGKIPEAFTAIQHAEEIVDKHDALALDRAIIDMVRALALVDTGRFDEARAIAITCASVFLEHGDLIRALNASMIEGQVLYETKRYADAYALYMSLIDIARATNDLSVEAGCNNNAGYCAVHLDEFKTANIHFSEAIAKFKDLGDSVNATRSHWGAGQVFIAKSQFENGLQHLEAARDAFTDFGMVEEAGLCGLAIAEALFSRGQDTQARELVREIAREFRDAPIERRVIDAVSTLERELVVNDAPAEAVRHAYARIRYAHTEHPIA